MNKQEYLKMMSKTAGWGDFFSDVGQALKQNVSQTAQGATKGIKNWSERRKANKLREEKEEKQKASIRSGVSSAMKKQKAQEKASAEKAHKEQLKDISRTAQQKAQKRLKDIQFRNYANKLLDKMFPVRTMSPLQRLDTFIPGAKQSNAELMQQGVPSFSLIQRLSKGKDKLNNQVGPLNIYGKLIGSGLLQPDEKAALDKNITTYQSYEGSGFWHKLMALLKQYWTKLTEGTDEGTERFKALLSGDRAANILSTIGKLGK